MRNYNQIRTKMIDKTRSLKNVYRYMLLEISMVILIIYMGISEKDWKYFGFLIWPFMLLSDDIKWLRKFT